MLSSAFFYLLLAYLVYQGYQLTVLLGVFKDNFYNHKPGPCRYVQGHDPTKGSEDLTILPNGIAIVSSGIKGGGAILMVDLNATPEKAVPLEITGAWTKASTPFRPHGISAWTNPKNGEVTLGVVNHAEGGERIEIFRLDTKGKKLHFLKGIKAEGLGMLNDLVLMDDGAKFYVTEFLRGGPSTLVLENVLALPIGRVFFYDGQQFRLVATGLSNPNGINISPDGKYVYVAECSANRVAILQRSTDAPDLTLLQRTWLGSVVDNIEVDRDTGDLWIGAHPVHWRILAREFNIQGYLAPSQVLRLKVKDGQVKDIIEVFYDDGARLATGSVGSLYKKKLIVGTVMQQLYVCDANAID